jgi:hypothetical protein
MCFAAVEDFVALCKMHWAVFAQRVQCSIDSTANIL